MYAHTKDYQSTKSDLKVSDSGEKIKSFSGDEASTPVTKHLVVPNTEPLNLQATPCDHDTESDSVFDIDCTCILCTLCLCILC